MRQIITVLFSLALIFTVVTVASAGGSLVETVAKGCEKELNSYCANVTPGEGRILACLYAHGDKLSGQCEYALYDAAVQLERAVAALSYLANECDADLEQYCASVTPGQGRLIDCLDRNSKKISNRCKQALEDVGLK